MSFNTSSCKRLTVAANVSRFNHQVPEVLNTIATAFLSEYLDNLTVLMAYCNKKTITVNDIKFISTINYRFPKIICSNKPQFHFSKMSSQLAYPLYTTKKPFRELVRKLLKVELRFTKEAFLVLQSIVEHFLIKIINLSHYFNEKDTLFPENITMTIKKLYPQFNEGKKL